MRYISILIMPFMFFLFTGCEEASVKPKEYPFVITKNVMDIDRTGATFDAELLDSGNEKIIDFGFMWTNSRTNFEISLMENGGKLTNFSYRCSSDLDENIGYNCKAYIRTINRLVLSNDVYFKSKGSLN